MNRTNLSVLAMLLSSCALQAQEVEAHFAQHLVTKEMSAHPELQKMGIHVVPPGQSDDIIIACSVPSKIGKKSSENDLAVERSGKSAVKTITDKSFYDMAIPLNDAGKHQIGLLVMEVKFSGASSADDALAKSEAIRDEMASHIPDVASLYKPAPASDPLVLLRTTKLTDIVGDFDHFAVDSKTNRLFVSAEVHHSIEVFNLKTGEHVQSAPVATTPHTLAFDRSSNTLLIADGGDNSCRLLDAATLVERKRIPLEGYPDAGIYDAKKNIFYVGNGGAHAKMDYSFISFISPTEGKEMDRIRVESNNLEAMALDETGTTLYVNMRDKNTIGVVDLVGRNVKTVWTIPGLKMNTPMAIDAVHHRLFVAGRQPGTLLILNSENGQVLAHFDAVEKADDMTFDPASGRIYVTGSGGVTIVHQDSPDKYTKVTQFETNAGKTSVLVPSLHQFYIIHTKTDLDAAALQVYRVNNTEGSAE